MHPVAERIWTLLDQARTHAPEQARLKEARDAYNDYGQPVVVGAWLTAFFIIQQFAQSQKRDPNGVLAIEPSWEPTEAEAALLGGAHRANQIAVDTWQAIAMLAQQHPESRNFVARLSTEYKGNGVYLFVEWALDGLAHVEAHSPGQTDHVLSEARAQLERMFPEEPEPPKK